MKQLGWVLGLLALASSPARADKPCVDGGDRAENAAVSTTAATFCFDKGSCYSADLATGHITVGKPAPSELPVLAEAPDAPKLTDGESDITVCRHDGTQCKKLATKHEIDPGIGFVSAVNASGTLAAIGVQGEPFFVDVFDVASGKRTTFKLPSGGGLCGTLAFAGDTLDASRSECGTNTGKEWLASKSGKVLARIGGASPIMTGGPPVHVTDDVWAFAPDTGSVVVLQDVVTGKVMKRVAIGKADPNSLATLVGNSTHLVLVYGGARAGDLAVIDVATGKVTSFPANRCH